MDIDIFVPTCFKNAQYLFVPRSKIKVILFFNVYFYL